MSNEAVLASAVVTDSIPSLDSAIEPRGNYSQSTAAIGCKDRGWAGASHLFACNVPLPNCWKNMALHTTHLRSLSPPPAIRKHGTASSNGDYD